MFRSIRWRIAILYTILIFLAMAGLAIYLSNLVRQEYLADLRSQLAAEARMIADVLASSPAWDETGGNLEPAARHYADLLDARVTLVGMDGAVLGESHGDRTQMDNHLYRPEVQQALATGQGSSIRFSRTVGYDMMYVAVIVTAGERPVGIVRVALPLRQIEANVGRLRRIILTAMLFIALGAALLALFIAERTARPVRQLTDVVQRMAEGDLSARLLPTTQDEVGTLTRSFNQMADRLRKTVSTLIEERGRLAAVLDNMADGVIITDGEGRVRLINPMAAHLLGTDTETYLGRSFAQVVRDHRIISLWQQCFEQGEEQVDLVEVDRRRSFWQVIVTPLRDAEPGACLVILQDLTRVRQLETIRRDFISNVSHELRTPLASLKALTETLRDGALSDPSAALHFLSRIETEVDVLSQMTQELLDLSRIESGQMTLNLSRLNPVQLLNAAAERMRAQAERAGLVLMVEAPATLLEVWADGARVEQVLVNLIHNAVKFTPAPGVITLSAQADGLFVRFTVKDTGIGISEEDLERVFERFYKTDRSRSGSGTGLGLSISRHIVELHGGKIWVESREGEGSSFQFTLPVAR